MLLLRGGPARVVSVHVNDDQWPDGLARVTPDMHVGGIHACASLFAVSFTVSSDVAAVASRGHPGELLL
jgi:hypothetical protein